MRRVAGLLVVLAIGGCAERSLERAPVGLADALDRGLTRSAVVMLDVSDDDSLAAYEAKKARVRAAAPSVEVLHTLDQLPMVAVKLRTRSELDRVLMMPEVLGVEEEVEYRAFDDLQLINQPVAIASGLDGHGTTVAVLDTGVDWKRAAFGTCSAPGTAGCKVAASLDIAPDDASLDDNGHGTNVAGIVSMVAPGARVVVLDVFDGNVAKSTDLMAAMNWVLANRATYNLVAVNLSLGGGSSSTPCANDAMESVFQRARAAGVLPAVASGNDGFTDKLASPACAPSAVSVGAVYDRSVGKLITTLCTDPTTAPDQVACFSNTAPFLTLFAPGVGISAAGITMSGTSQATPHVAGAAAILRSAFPSEIVEQTVSRLVNTGVPVRDAKASVTRPRIDLGAATAGGMDTTAPTGSVRIGTGATYVNRAAQTLTITAEDPSGVAKMCVTAADQCTAWEPYAPTKAFTLPAGDGPKTVRVWLTDGRGNQSPTPLTAAVALDTTPPTAGTASAKPSSATQVVVAWAGVSDAGGVGNYFVYGASPAPPSGCGGTPLFIGSSTTTSWVHAGLVGGKLYGYRVCAVDRAGNVSAGAVASATTPAPDLAPPTGVSLTINGGAPFTRSAAVRLQVTAMDASGVFDCLTNGSSCTTFAPLVGEVPWTLPSGEGKKTVSAWFKDGAGNALAQPAQASIVVDTVPPSNPVLTAQVTPQGVILNWSPSTDATSGVDHYRVVRSPGTVVPLASCVDGDLVYDGPARTVTVISPGAHRFRVCAYDRAGNVSVGSSLWVQGWTLAPWTPHVPR